ncbi:hypothetical protein D6829_01225 [Candidatus Pacearchaeota archaeon]|nr:MAG: hypothetical protein D6829_01225 [Candidatus Pacearchaeota archaeon]
MGIVNHTSDNPYGMYFVSDARGEYLPATGRIKRSPIGHSTNLVSVNLQKRTQGFHNFLRETFVAKNPTRLSNYQLLKKGVVPSGLIYLGDLSFRDLKELNSVIKNTSLAISLIYPNHLTAATYSFTSTVDNIFGKIEDIVDDLNEFFGTNIDLDQKFSFFLESPLGSIKPSNFIGFFPSIYVAPSINGRLAQNVPVSLLYPLKDRNYWVFEGGGKRVKFSAREELLKGFTLATTVKSSEGLEEYTGVKGDRLLYVGMNFPGIPQILFDPGISLGDSAMDVGWRSTQTSTLVAEERPEISGTISFDRSVEGRSSMKVSGLRYGDVLKIRDYATVVVKNKNTGKQASGSSESYMWFAPNVGPIRIEESGERYDLVDFGVEDYYTESAEARKANPIVRAIRQVL